MKTTLIESRLAKILILICFGILLATMLPAAVFAGGTPNALPIVQLGAAWDVSNGDYLSASSGLRTSYRYYIEVPQGQSTLYVDLFDAFVLANATYDLDTNANNSTTSAKYTLYNPSGTAVSTWTCANAYNATNCPAASNNWANFYNVANPAAGHWYIEINMANPTTFQGGDANNFGIRANTGAGNTGTDLNVYAEFYEIGTRNTALPLTYTFYPFITSGCNFNVNNFDWDEGNNNANTGSQTMTSPHGVISTQGTLSGQSVWQNYAVSGWTNDVTASDYGIWTQSSTISSFGGTGGNYATLYLSKSGTSGAPANPLVWGAPANNRYRTYFPTRTGTAPVKPYVTQALASVSGPNPPVSGSTSILRVQVVVVNPTVYPITFSASNLVTANVPGGQVLYNGNASVSFGTIIGQPAIGGSGNITWNPTTVAANSAVTLQYEIRVTPDSTSRVVVTGTPAANGTTATYVDETGNTTQGLATYTFGPLCELAVSGITVPTLATLKSFDAYLNKGRVVVEWSTSSELNTVGFYLFRKDGDTGQSVPVTVRMLPSAIDNSKAGIYRLIDAGATAGKTYTYMLTEVEARGKTRQYGPFIVTPRTNTTAKLMSSQFQRESIQTATVKGQTRLQKLAARKAVSGSRARIELREDGIYSLNATTIAGLLGISLPEAVARIKTHDFILSNQGQTVAYMSDVQNSRIIFYGQGIKSNYTDENIYWLTRGSGVIMQNSSDSAAAPSAEPVFFANTIHYEKNNINAPFFATDPAENYWYWDYVVGGDQDLGTKTFNLNVTGLSANSVGSIAVNLKGAYASDQRAIIALNGQALGEGTWQGNDKRTIILPVSEGMLKEGFNQLDVKGAQDSLFFVDSFDLVYNRLFIAQDDSLKFSSDQNSVVTVSGFSGSDIKVFDISDPLKPRVVQPTINGNKAAFRPGASNGQYIAISGSAIKGVAGATGKAPAGLLKNSRNSADYLIITSDELKDAASSLAAYRAAQGYRTMIATVEDIMDEFNYGIYSPEAIKNFIAFAKRQWSIGPKYIVLAGGGTYDYKDYLDMGGQQVPPMMVATPDGLVPSDNYFADINGDHIPEIAIGRLPASSSDELRGIIGKIIAYEKSATGEWAKKVLLVADIPDEGGDFNNDIDEIAKLDSAKYMVTKLYHTVYPDTAAMNARLVSGINEGVGFVSYFGHGTVDSLSQDSFFMKTDVVSLSNSSKLPVATAMTCVVGDFAEPGINSLGEMLVQKIDGGAVALWAATGLSDDKQALKLDSAFFSAVAEGSTHVLGDLVLSAIKNAGISNKDLHMLDMYIILGDPALKVKSISIPVIKKSKGIGG